MPSRAEEVLDFWFGREGEPGYGEFRDVWFRKDPEFDAGVTDRFAGLYEEAAAGDLDGWRDDARSCLALVIVLDQFPRNMFRGDGRTHAADEAALASSRYAVEHALDRELPAFQRMFLYMPFMHSENREDQRRSVELFGLLADEQGGARRNLLRRRAQRHRRAVRAVPAQERDPGQGDYARGGRVPEDRGLFVLS